MTGDKKRENEKKKGEKDGKRKWGHLVQTTMKGADVSRSLAEVQEKQSYGYELNKEKRNKKKRPSIDGLLPPSHSTEEGELAFSLSTEV